MPVSFYQRCDVTNPDELGAFFSELHEPIDILVHSIAYANPETFALPIHQISQADFADALTTSSYSLIPLNCAPACPTMPQGGSVIAMTYLGGKRVVANYKLIGDR
ncbi:MAG: SDR family oxidoreductase [Myxococcota bacterium]